MPARPGAVQRPVGGRVGGAGWRFGSSIAGAAAGACACAARVTEGRSTARETAPSSVGRRICGRPAPATKRLGVARTYMRIGNGVIGPGARCGGARRKNSDGSRFRGGDGPSAQWWSGEMTANPERTDDPVCAPPAAAATRCDFCGATFPDPDPGVGSGGTGAASTDAALRAAAQAPARARNARCWSRCRRSASNCRWW